jgi:hypothetical protein
MSVAGRQSRALDADQQSCLMQKHLRWKSRVLQSPSGKPSVLQTLAQLVLLMQAPLKLWLCEMQVLASATVVVPRSASRARKSQSSNQNERLVGDRASTKNKNKRNKITIKNHREPTQNAPVASRRRRRRAADAATRREGSAIVLCCS